MHIRQIAFLTAALLLGSAISSVAFADDGTPGPDQIGKTIEVDGGSIHQILSYGGPGDGNGTQHDGGDGGRMEVTASTFNDPTVTIGVGSIGGKSAPTAGDGGDGGSVKYSETDAVVSAQLIVLSAGQEANHFGNTGGAGGDIEATIAGTHMLGSPPAFPSGVMVISRASYSETGGDGGDVKVDFSGKTNQLEIESSGGDGLILGDGGAITLTITGDVTGDVLLNVKKGAGTLIGGNGGGTDGTIEVSLQNGASVGGEIRASQAASAIIELAFKLATEDDVTAAYSTLQGNAAHGWITVNGEQFEWTGFTELKKNITSLAAQNPTAPIVVTIQPSSPPPPTSPGTTITPADGASQGSAFVPFEEFFRASGPREPRTPKVSKPTTVRKLICDNRAINAFLQSDGSIVVNVRVEGQRYAAGSTNEGAFNRAPGSRWNLSIVESNTLQVSLRDGTLVGSCQLE